MRRLSSSRFMICASLVVILIVAAMASISVQAAATPEPTVNPMMATMAGEIGVCPDGIAKSMLDTIATMTEEPTQEAAPPAVTSEPTQAAATSLKCLSGSFSGAAEVPTTGAKDATGFVFLSVHGSTGNLCYQVAVAHLTLPATELHIDKGAVGHAVTMVVSLHPRPDASGVAEGCVSAGKTLTTAMLANPADYSVNVFTTDFKNGAARAQLADYTAATMGMSTSVPGVNMTPEVTASS